MVIKYLLSAKLLCTCWMSTQVLKQNVPFIGHPYQILIIHVSFLAMIRLDRLQPDSRDNTLQLVTGLGIFPILPNIRALLMTIIIVSPSGISLLSLHHMLSYCWETERTASPLEKEIFRCLKVAELIFLYWIKQFRNIWSTECSAAHLADLVIGFNKLKNIVLVCIT